MSHQNSEFVLGSKEKLPLFHSQQRKGAAPARKQSPIVRTSKWGLLIIYYVFSVYNVISFIYGNYSASVLYESTSSLSEITQVYFNFLNSSNLASNWSREFTKASHLAGTNLELVHWQASKYEEFGLSHVEIEDFDIYLNYPVDNSLKLLSNSTVIYHPTLKEDELEQDPTTTGPGLVPAFHGYSASGNVTAEYIYANYGTREDFQKLKDNGIEVSGKIAIVRYGGLFRGLKVKFAQEAGAVGVLIYSEPSDDGDITVDNGYAAYPDGPARNPSSIQRGSVQFLSQIPGDPTTPGWPSKGDDVDRVDPHGSIPKIPSLPISYAEIQPILKTLNGHGTKFEGWEGGLPGVTYNVGPVPGYEINIYNEQDYKVRKIHNIYGEIEGFLKDQVILLGNHRDAWIKGGAGDPNSGSAVTLEVIRALNELKTKYGWKPLRTIRFASWDGEEYALLGSTEFGELYHKQLQKDVVAYLNLDDAVAGTQLNLEASPLLNGVLDMCAKQVQYPGNTSMTLYDHFYSWAPKIGMLGSGSDFTVFMEHLGITSMNVVFEPGPKDPIYHYHSNYDSYYWMSTFGDPGFVYHNTMAKFFGSVVLQLADNKAVQFGAVENAIEFSLHFNETAAKIPAEWYDNVLTSMPDESFDSEEFAELAEILSDNFKSWKEYQTDGESYGPSSMEKAITLAQESIAKLISASIRFQERFAKEVADYKYYDEHYSRFNPWAIIMKSQFARRIERSNKILKYLERSFLHYGGLHNRKWFRHAVYAVDRDNGYSAVALPGLLEGIQDESIGQVHKWLWILNGIAKRARFILEDDERIAWFVR
ncbi:putative zinc metalloprotease [Saccharomycopsis crataegensis]|uniref:Zinc metalloprotease n=1 Tax=Saccharomycopsis crataegensis TaxID=43959 RepID=A0AAV5QD43_9ASCO|nr:putative zinc metalloprotease [Saccharomycopsis crataegensis]